MAIGLLATAGGVAGYVRVQRARATEIQQCKTGSLEQCQRACDDGDLPSCLQLGEMRMESLQIGNNDLEGCSTSIRVDLCASLISSI